MPGLYAPNAINTPITATIKNVPRRCQMYPGGQNRSPLPPPEKEVQDVTITKNNPREQHPHTHTPATPIPTAAGSGKNHYPQWTDKETGAKPSYSWMWQHHYISQAFLTQSCVLTCLSSCLKQRMLQRIGWLSWDSERTGLNVCGNISLALSLSVLSKMSWRGDTAVQRLLQSCWW